ncbi:MAG: aldo/keto reductase [Chloroflexi bacterium]|nr:aldo/keto reductase [Chloroflexota bacterium]
MKYRLLGRSGVPVSEIGLGGNQFGSTCDARATAAIVDRALALGVTFIDTAESYGGGASEEVLGKALAGKRDQVVLASKTGAPDQGPGGRLTRARLIARLEGSLTRLATDYVDVYYFHYPDPVTPLEESLRALDELIRSGKVRYAATSNHASWQVAEAAGICAQRDYSAPVASQVQYSLIERSPENEMIPACERFGVSLVPYSPLGSGFLTGKYRKGAPLPEGARLTRVERARTTRFTDTNWAALERYDAFATKRGHTVKELAISWLLAQPVVCSVIAGVTSPAQVEENVKAAEWTLMPDEVRELG